MPTAVPVLVTANVIAVPLMVVVPVLPLAPMFVTTLPVPVIAPTVIVEVIEDEPARLAVTVRVPAVAPMSETEQLPELRVHVLRERMPFVLLVLKPTVPEKFVGATLIVHGVVAPTTIEYEVHTRLNAVGVPASTETLAAFSELPWLLESPEYEALMVTAPVDEGATKVVKQLEGVVSVVRTHAALGLNEPDPTLNVTVPVGEEPVTVTVHSVDAPSAIVDGLQATTVTVATCTPAVMVKVADVISLFVVESLTTTMPLLEPLVITDMLPGMLPEPSVVNCRVEEHVLALTVLAS